MTKKFAIAGYDHSISKIMTQLGFTEVRAVVEADVVCFPGGADIYPGIYGHPQVNSLTRSVIMTRDAAEIAFFQTALNLGKAMIGFCRGAQLLHALNGGTLYQHVDRHQGNRHDTTDITTGKVYSINSIHHQMMYPNSYCTIIAVTKNLATQRFRWDEKLRNVVDDGTGDDIEALSYEKTRCLCIQGHPEYEGFITSTNTAGLLKDNLHRIGV